MTNLVKFNNEATMTSYEFLTNIINPARIEVGENEVRNRVFVARIEDELDDLGASKNFARFGNEVKYYDLTLDQMMLVGMRESKAVRKNVLAKLKAMERNKDTVPQSLPDFTKPAEAARAWADEIEAKQIAMQKLEEVAPKTEALDRIAYADGAMNITLAAKTLQLQPKKLFSYLSNKKWIYRRAGGKNWLGYQDKIQQSLISHKVTIIQIDGEERIQEQVLITPKGLSKLSVEINTLI